MIESGPLGLFCDLYELTMAAAYHRGEMDRRATFDLFARHLPERRGYLVACGVDAALESLTRFRFSSDDIAVLAGTERFDDDFLDRLGEFRFDGDVRAVREGEIVFAAEPFMTVTADLLTAQVVETLLINAVGFPTLVATKAARVAEAAAGTAFVDFSARRDQGRQAAAWAARASMVGGAGGTSLVSAAREGMPLSGTMAHSYVQAFDDEREAFLHFTRSFPDSSVLLVDTYDVEIGVQRAIEVADEVAADGITIRAVRIDSGDLAVHARRTREQLDESGHPEIGIFLSGDLDEYRIQALTEARTPVDGYGVGTKMGTSSDAPALGMVYKLVHDETGPRIKLSEGKQTHPGLKQVHRLDDHDVIGLAGEEVPAEGRPLLEEAMTGGEVQRPASTVDEAARFAREQLDRLPPRVRSLEAEPDVWPVKLTPALEQLSEEAVALADERR